MWSVVVLLHLHIKSFSLWYRKQYLNEWLKILKPKRVKNLKHFNTISKKKKHFNTTTLNWYLVFDKGMIKAIISG